MSPLAEVRLVESPDTPEKPFDPRLVRSGALTRGSLLIVANAGDPTPASLIEAAGEIIGRDNRVASVSNCDSALSQLSALRGRIRLASPALQTGAQAFASAPAGSQVILNCALFDLVGYPELTNATGSSVVDEVLRWSAEANHRGLRHCWFWSGETSEQDPLVSPSALDVAEAGDSASPIGFLLDRHRAAFDALTISVDATWLGPNETGAQVATVHWLAALAERTDIAELRLHGLPGGRLPNYASHLASFPTIRIAKPADPPTDIHWRPYQPDALTSALRDRTLGRRLVTTVLDLIDHSNEFYHSDTEAWRKRRRALRTYLTSVDMVTTISADVAEHVKAEVPGLPPKRVHETPLGVDHLLTARVSEPPPDLLDAWPEIADCRFILVLGNDFVHKNRDFALRVWQGASAVEPVDLVLAGLHVRDSSTRAIEDVLMSQPTSSRCLAVRLQHVSGAAKTWLLANAVVVLYPSSAEGFGFIPHEAASLGTACLATSFGPLREFLPDEALVRGWSVQEYVSRISELLADESLRQTQIEQIRAEGEELTWRASATELARAFRLALSAAPRICETSGSAVPGVEIGDEAQALAEVLGSLSWRVTRPLRSASENARKAKRRLRAKS